MKEKRKPRGSVLREPASKSSFIGTRVAKGEMKSDTRSSTCFTPKTLSKRKGERKSSPKKTPPTGRNHLYDLLPPNHEIPPAGAMQFITKRKFRKPFRRDRRRLLI